MHFCLESAGIAGVQRLQSRENCRGEEEDERADLHDGIDVGVGR